MAKEKMTKCKSCGTEISAVGKVTCPKCGRVNKPPFYKSAGFIILCIVLVIIIISVASSSSDADKTTKNASVVTSENTEVVEVEPVIEPTVVTVDEIVKAFEGNALKAASTYENSYVKLTGRLSSVDGDGDYFSLEPMYEDYSFKTVECRYKKEYLDAVMNLTVGQEVTVIGTITSLEDVFTLMSCKLQVESIK